MPTTFTELNRMEKELTRESLLKAEINSAVFKFFSNDKNRGNEVDLKIGKELITGTSLETCSYYQHFNGASKVIKVPGDKVEVVLKKKNQVNHPSHYNLGKIEVIDAIEDWKLDFSTGNAVKYIARAGKKNPEKEVEDLEKAIWYLNRKLSKLKK